jgi:hypothetical protein
MGAHYRVDFGKPHQLPAIEGPISWHLTSINGSEKSVVFDANPLCGSPDGHQRFGFVLVLVGHIHLLWRLPISHTPEQDAWVFFSAFFPRAGMKKTRPKGGHPSFDLAQIDVFKRPLKDRFLFAIIDAYQGSSPDDLWPRERLRRLDAAKAALFGVKLKRGAKPIDDSDSLWFMARELHSDLSTRTLVEMFKRSAPPQYEGVRSDLALARLAAARTGTKTPTTAVERLSDAFGERKRELLAALESEDDLNSQLGHNLLMQALRAIEPLGLAAKAPSSPAGPKHGA